MKSKILIILLFTLILSCDKSQTIIIDEEEEKELFGHIEGVIIDGITKEAIENVIVSTYPPTTTTLTDEEGKFLLENINVGQFKLITEKYNYYNKPIFIAVNSERTSKAYISLYDLNSHNEAPNKPVIITPTKLSLTNDFINLKLEWFGTDPDLHNLTYDVFLDTINTNMRLYVKDTTESSIIIEDTLLQDKEYYLKIISRDIFGDETESDIVKFKTKSLLNDVLLGDVVSFKLDEDQMYSSKIVAVPKITKSKIAYAENREKDPNKSIYFNGDSYVQIDDVFGIDQYETFSVSLWIKLNSDDIGKTQNGYTDLIGKFGGTGVGKSSWGVILNNNKNLGFASYDGKDFNYAYSNKVLELNKWINVVVVYSSLQVTIFQDGELVANANCVVPQNSSNPIVIGARYSTPSYFKGFLDDIIIYDRKLTIEEVNVLRNN